MAPCFPDKLSGNAFALQNSGEGMPRCIGADLLINLQLLTDFVHVIIDPLGKTLAAVFDRQRR